MNRKTQVDFIKTALRLPPELHGRVHESAAEHGRTYNAELISRLEASFEPPKVHLTDDQAKNLADEIMAQIYVKASEPEILQADDIVSLLRHMENRRAEEGNVLSNLAVKAEQLVHSIYAEEGETERYRYAKEKLIQLRELQSHHMYWTRLLFDESTKVDPMHTDFLVEPEIKPAPRKKAK